MGAVSCYIEHVITFEFVSEFVSAFAFVSCCIRFFHLHSQAQTYSYRSDNVSDQIYTLYRKR